MGIPRNQVEHLLSGKSAGKRKPRRNKYNVAPKAERTYDGHVFHSKKECKRYRTLNMLRIKGLIRCLTLQPMFPLPGGVRYYADFSYIENKWGPQGLITQWEWIVEDCKGFKTECYRLKKKQVEAIYGIKIRET